MITIDRAKHKKILSISLPAAFNSLLDMLQVITDLIMVGTISAVAVASVGMGLQALISRFYGAKRMKQGSLALATLLRFALLLSFPMTLFWYFGSTAFYGWMGVALEVQELGSTYVSILTLMIPFILLKYVFVTALNATGDTTTPMYVKIASIVFNVSFNYLLIFGN